MIYFGLILAFAHRFDRRIGVGTIISTMLGFCWAVAGGAIRNAHAYKRTVIVMVSSRFMSSKPASPATLPRGAWPFLLKRHPLPARDWPPQSVHARLTTEPGQESFSS